MTIEQFQLVKLEAIESIQTDLEATVQASADLALAANEAAEAAASASGAVLFYDTKAAADSALSGLAEGQIVEVMADESVSGLRTRYRKTSESYVFKVILGEAKVATVAALRAIPYSAMLTTAQTLGVSAAGDGGGGTWRWDASSSASDNTGTVVSPTGHVGNGRWLRVYDGPLMLEWFKGYAGTDYLAALTAATAAISSGTIQINGYYELSDKYIGKSNVHLIGKDTSCGLYIKSGENKYLLWYTGAQDFSVKNLKLDGSGNTTAVSATGLVYLGSTSTAAADCAKNYVFENVVFYRSAKDCVYLDDKNETTPTNAVFSHCVFDGAARNGVAVLGGSGIVFDTCRIINTSGTRTGYVSGPSYGIDIEPLNTQIVKNITISNCYFYGNDADDIALTGTPDAGEARHTVQDVVITGCNINKTGGLGSKNAVFGTRVRNVIITGNLIYGVQTNKDATSGIRINGPYGSTGLYSTDIVIFGNIIKEQQTGIMLSNGVLNSTVIGNQIFCSDTVAGTDTAGIYLGSYKASADTHKNCVVMSNYVFGNSVEPGILCKANLQNSIIQGNVIDTCTDGIKCVGGFGLTNPAIVDNTFNNCTTNLTPISTCPRRYNFPPASAAPSTGGPYIIGDVVYNSAPATSGYIGWVCTVAGSPGTWKPFGLIA